MLSFHTHTSPGRRCSSVTLFCPLFLQTPPSAATILAVTTIVGSAHDLPAGGITIQIIDTSHTTHANNRTLLWPLWNHLNSTNAYTLYANQTMDVPAKQPGRGSPSRLSLSCHDGTISIDSFSGNPGTPDKIEVLDAKCYITPLKTRNLDLLCHPKQEVHFIIDTMIIYA